jgi:hypothetical protein
MVAGDSNEEQYQDSILASLQDFQELRNAIIHKDNDISDKLRASSIVKVGDSYTLIQIYNPIP